MKVYLYKPDVDHYRPFEMCNPADWSTALQFAGEPIEESSWSAPQVRPIDDEDHTDLPLGDFPYVTTYPVMSERAVRCLGELLVRDAQFLPLRWNGVPLYGVNVTTVLDALDEARSIVHYLPSGPVVAIKRHEFRAEVVRGHTMFKIVQQKVANIYVTDEVVEAVRSCGLLGAPFTLVWSQVSA